MLNNLKARLYGCFSVETGLDYILPRLAKNEVDMKNLEETYKKGGIYTKIFLVVGAGESDDEYLTPSCIAKIVLENKSRRKDIKNILNKIDDLLYSYILEERFENIYGNTKGRTIKLNKSAFDYLQLIKDWGITLEHILDFEYSLNN